MPRFWKSRIIYSDEQFIISGPRRVAYATDLVMFVLVTIINLQIQTLMYGATVLNSNDEVKG
jgi:hypothetical protein